MRNPPDRLTFTVTRDRDQWAVEHLGEHSEHSRDRNEVLAAANRLARKATDAGQACQVRMSGQVGCFS